MPQISSNSESNTRNDDKDLEKNSKDDVVLIETTEQESTQADVGDGSSRHESENDEAIEGKF